MKSRILSMLAIVAVFCCGFADAQVPRKLNYQGFLTSPSGAPVNSVGMQMVFNIYNVQTLGSPLHTETQTVPVSNGVFNVVLGTSTALTLPFDAQYYLGVTPGADPEMSPRQPLEASPYAIRSASAETATKLATARTINGVAFDGTANITVPATNGPMFAMFFGLTSGTGNGGPTDYAATVPVSGRVPFPRNGPVAGGIVRLDASSFLLPAVGIYEITFRVHTTEPGQLQLELNGFALASTVAANLNPTSGGHPISGNFFITTTSINSTLAVVNPAGNATALTITPANGATVSANTQSLTIKRID